MSRKNDKNVWENIKAEYIQGGVSERKLAEKYGVHRSTLQGHIQREGWQRLRDEATTKSEEKLVEIISASQADTMAHLSEMQARAAKIIYGRLLKSLDKYADDDAPKVTDLESITRSMVNLGRLFGIDAKTELERETLQLQRKKINPDEGGEMPDDGFIEALNNCMDVWKINDVPEYLEDTDEPGSMSLKPSQRPTQAPTEQEAPPDPPTIEGPAAAPATDHSPQKKEYRITGEVRDGCFVFFQIDPQPSISPKRLLIDGHTYQRIFPRDNCSLPSIGIEAPGSYIGKAVILIE